MGEAIVRRGSSFRLLLEVERARERRGSDARRLIGPALALANLFLLAYAERFVRNDTGVLFPILSIDLVLFLFLSLSHILSSASTALDRTAIFPLMPIDRYLYLLAGTLRSMPVLYWSASLLLAFAILYHQTPGIFAGIQLLLGLLLLGSESWIALLYLLLRRRGISAGWVLVFPFFSLSLAWMVARGITGMAAGSWLEAGGAAGVLVGLLAVAYVTGRRVC